MAMIYLKIFNTVHTLRYRIIMLACLLLGFLVIPRTLIPSCPFIFLTIFVVQLAYLIYKGSMYLVIYLLCKNFYHLMGTYSILLSYSIGFISRYLIVGIQSSDLCLVETLRVNAGCGLNQIYYSSI